MMKLLVTRLILLLYLTLFTTNITFLSEAIRWKPEISFSNLHKKEENNNNNNIQNKQNMGQVMRTMSYDRAANERNAITSLKLFDERLSWYRLDDGVMGGQSETVHSDQDGRLAFEGTINTNGGGFCSIRTKISESVFPTDTQAIRLKFIGDGRTYKILLSDGSKSTFGPSRKSPSWQADIPTNNDEKEQVIDIPISSFQPSWVFGPSKEEKENAKFDISSMRELGLMLSLKLSDGSANPVETFGDGIFPFSLKVLSIETMSSSSS
jgi:hypothetical protein